jgi:hypothetical protein
VVAGAAQFAQPPALFIQPVPFCEESLPLLGALGDGALVLGDRALHVRFLGQVLDVLEPGRDGDPAANVVGSDNAAVALGEDDGRPQEAPGRRRNEPSHRPRHGRSPQHHQPAGRRRPADASRGVLKRKGRRAGRTERGTCAVWAFLLDAISAPAALVPSAAPGGRGPG